MAVTVPKQELWKAVRAKCMDCCCQQMNEVDMCPAKDCPLYPYRYGKAMQTRDREMAKRREKHANIGVQNA